MHDNFSRESEMILSFSRIIERVKIHFTVHDEEEMETRTMSSLKMLFREKRSSIETIFTWSSICRIEKIQEKREK